MLIELINNTTNTEISNESKELRENSLQILTKNFQLEVDDALTLLGRLAEESMRRLWHVYITLYPKLKQIAEQLMEKVDGNIQMVEDLIQFEITIGENRTAAWKKFRIPTYFEQGKSIGIIPLNQTKTLLAIRSDLIMEILKPLRKNLTATYQARHPDKKVQTGRDIDLFLKYTHSETWQRNLLPDFMYDNTTINFHRQPSTGLSNYSTPSLGLINNPMNAQGNTTNINFLLVGDILIFLLLIGFFIHLLTPFTRCRNYFFGNNAAGKISLPTQTDIENPANDASQAFTKQKIKQVRS